MFFVLLRFWVCFVLGANHFINYKVSGDNGYFPYYHFISSALCKYCGLQGYYYADIKLGQCWVHVAKVIYSFTRIIFYLSDVSSFLLLARATFC